MRNLIFAAALLVLGGICVVFPGTIGYGVAGAVAATVAWLYFSLRDADLERGIGSIDLNDGDGIGGPALSRSSARANQCADPGHGGVSCDVDNSGGDHA